MLYNCYYVPHIVISLMIVGLIFAKTGSRKPLWNYARLLLLLIVSFLGGLGGVRQLMMTHAPALLAVFIYYFADDYIHKSVERVCEKKRVVFAIRAAGAAAFSFFGLLINKVYFTEKYTFVDYSKNTIRLLKDSIDQVLYGYFHHFGFRDEIKLFSVTGALSALGIVLGIYCLIASVCGIIKYAKHANIQNALPYVFFLSYIIVMLTVFFIAGDGYYYVLYLTPTVIWMIPVFVLQAKNAPKHLSFLNLKKTLPYLMVAIIFVNGFANSVFLVGGGRFNQKYEGLKYKTHNAGAIIKPAVLFLQENGYDLGYATFWNSNISTEVSNGEIKMITVYIDSDDGEMHYYDWLTLQSNRTLQDKKEFLLLSLSEYQTSTKKPALQNCPVVYKDDNYVVCDLSKITLFE